MREFDFQTFPKITNCLLRVIEAFPKIVMESVRPDCSKEKKFALKTFPRCLSSL